MLKEEFKTTTIYQPVNGRMLIKVVTNDFPTMNLVSGSKPNRIGDIKMFIAGTSVSGYELNQEVLVDPAIISDSSNKIFDNDNEFSYTNIKAHINGLKRSEYEKFVKTNPRVTIVEYVMVHYASIIAIVNRKTSVTKK